MFGYPKLETIKFIPGQKINDFVDDYLDYFIINDRYEIYDDGVVYDTEKAKDIPKWIFDLRDNLVKE